MSLLARLSFMSVVKIVHFTFHMLLLYLIGICSDKLASSLVQNAPEPIANFGCVPDVNYEVLMLLVSFRKYSIK